MRTTLVRRLENISDDLELLAKNSFGAKHRISELSLIFEEGIKGYNGKLVAIKKLSKLKDNLIASLPVSGLNSLQQT